MAKLQLLSARGDVLQEFALPGVEATIGRGSDCTVVVRDAKMSRRHARLVLAGPGGQLQDLGSDNGILVDQKRVSGALLVDGAVFQLGDSAFRFVIEAPDLDETIKAGGAELLPTVIDQPLPPPAPLPPSEPTAPLPPTAVTAARQPLPPQAPEPDVAEPDVAQPHGPAEPPEPEAAPPPPPQRLAPPPPPPPPAPAPSAPPALSRRPMITPRPVVPRTRMAPEPPPEPSEPPPASRRGVGLAIIGVAALVLVTAGAFFFLSPGALRKGSGPRRTPPPRIEEPTPAPAPTPRPAEPIVQALAPELAKLGELATIPHPPADWATGPMGGTFPVEPGTRLAIPEGAFPAPVSLRTARVDLALSRVRPSVRRAWAYVVATQGIEGPLAKPVALEIERPPDHVRFALLEGGSWHAVPVPPGAVARIELAHFSARYVSAIEWASPAETPAEGDSAALDELLSGRASASPAAAPLRSCQKTFTVQGVAADGKQLAKKLVVARRFYDFEDADLEKATKDAAARYAGSPTKYDQIRPATWKQDGAGSVLESLWGQGPYWVTAENLFANVVKPYGTKVPRRSVQKGDVAVWGEGGKHVAMVTAVSGLYWKDVTVQTKDGPEPMFRNVLSWSGDDPLAGYGEVEIWRVDKAKVKVTPESPEECDGTPGAPVAAPTTTSSVPRP